MIYAAFDKETGKIIDYGSTREQLPEDCIIKVYDSFDEFKKIALEQM